MPPKRQLIVPGFMFGMAKVIQEVDVMKGERRTFHCECTNCGVHFIRKLDDLKKTNRPQTCGKCHYRKDAVIVKPGDKYGEYTLIREIALSKSGKRMVLVKGPFGIKESSLQDWLSNKLKKSINPIISHGMHKSYFYKIYYGILDRCNNHNTNHYDRYGGRGIKCEWKSFEEFKTDMYESYLEAYIENKNISIDRIDNDGNYCKENCRWATKKEQANNTSKNIIIPIQYKGKTLFEICNEFKIPRSTFYTRYRKGYSFEECLHGKN